MSGSDLTRDDFLGGRLTICQPASGYRAGADAVFLAAAVPARSGQSVLDLGCGVGVAGLALARRVEGLDVYGVEIQPDHAELARLNGARNGIDLAVETCDLAHLPATLRARSFDHVIANPPYFRGDQSPASPDGARNMARTEQATPLAAWFDAAARRLVPGGTFTLIQKADRLAETLTTADAARWGDLRVLPLAPRTGRAATVFILRARKDRHGPLRLLAPLILHDGDQHDGDKDSYSAIAQAVLRGGDAISVDWG